MNDVMTFAPAYYGAIIRTKAGDARLICMVQEENRSLSIHFFQVDTSLDDSEFKVFVFRDKSFRSELRGTSLAVKLIDDASCDDAEDIIARCLVDAYGADAELDVKKINRPSILSLFG